MRGDLRVAAYHIHMARAIGISVWRRLSETEDQVAKVIMETVTNDPAAALEVIEPTLTITRETAMSLMDELWGLGIRPSAADGTMGQTKAMQEHINDLRRMAFEAKPLYIGNVKEAAREMSERDMDALMRKSVYGA